jgi:hypothetical protein
MVNAQATSGLDWDEITQQLVCFGAGMCAPPLSWADNLLGFNISAKTSLVHCY